MIGGEEQGQIGDRRFLPGFWPSQSCIWDYIYCSRERSEHRFTEGNLDSWFHPVQSDILIGHWKRCQVQNWMYSWKSPDTLGLEMQLPNLRAGLDGDTQGHSVDRVEGPGLSPENDRWVCPAGSGRASWADATGASRNLSEAKKGRTEVSHSV